jgi:hypothetical protein
MKSLIDSLCLSLMNIYLLVCGFFSKLGIFAVHMYIVNLTRRQLNSTEGQLSFLRINDP